jgi:hypothetical protein
MARIRLLTIRLSHSFSKLAKNFVKQVSEKIVERNHSFLVANQTVRSSLTTVENADRSTLSSVNHGYQQADYNAQLSAMQAMSTRDNSPFVAAQTNLANKRSVWWAGLQLPLGQRDAGLNQAATTLTSSINTADTLALSTIDPAAVAYATKVTLAKYDNTVALSNHHVAMVNTVADVWSQAEGLVIPAAKSRDLTVAAAERDFAINGNQQQFDNTKNNALQSFAGVLNSATAQFNTTSASAKSQQAAADAQSNTELADKLAQASKDGPSGP